MSEATSTEGTAETEDEIQTAMYNTLVLEGVAEGRLVAQVENMAWRGGRVKTEGVVVEQVTLPEDMVTMRERTVVRADAAERMWHRGAGGRGGKDVLVQSGERTWWHVVQTSIKLVGAPTSWRGSPGKKIKILRSYLQIE